MTLRAGPSARHTALDDPAQPDGQRGLRSWFTPARVRVLGVFVFSLAVFLLWWAAFYPGIMTVDSMQAWEQAEAWIFQDWHPVFHTWVIAVLTRVWFSPAIVSLAQAIFFAAVLASLTRRLERARVRPLLAVGVPCLIALSPQSGFMSTVLWKDVPFAISVLWVFCEVLDVAADPARFFASRWRCARFGAALLAVLLFRQNGTLVAGIVLLGVVAVFRRYWRELALTVAVSFGGYALVTGPLYTYLDAWPTPALFTYTTFMHDMAAFVTYHADEMSPDEVAFLEQILPLERWSVHDDETNPDGLYYCRQATPLIFPPEFYPSQRVDRDGNLVPTASLPAVVTQNPQSVFLEQHTGEFRDLWFRFVRRWPDTFLGQRFCVGSLAWSPWHRSGLEVLVPPRRIIDNSNGLATAPLSHGLSDVMNGVLDVWGREGPRVLTWRAAPWAYFGFVCCWLGAKRRRDWRFLVVVLPGFAAWFSVLTFTPGQSSRYMFPAYLCGVAALAFLGRPRTPPAEPALHAPASRTSAPRPQFELRDPRTFGDAPSPARPGAGATPDKPGVPATPAVPPDPPA